MADTQFYPTLPCVIFDLDGTLFDHQHRIPYLLKDPPDWEGCFAAMDLDTPITAMHTLFRVFKAGVEQTVVVVLTGTPERFRGNVKDRLERHGLFADALIMRPDGDTREDADFKRAALDLMRKQNWEITMVFEDRDSVVKMWRDAGVLCLQVESAPELPIGAPKG